MIFPDFELAKIDFNNSGIEEALFIKTEKITTKVKSYNLLRGSI